MTDRGPPRDASLPPGYDEEDPYEGEDLSTYPDWWRENVEEFRDHGMRPYRPPRFLDGALVPAVIESLETDLSVTIRLRALDPQDSGGWKLEVDGERVGTVKRRRTGDGYSLYELSSDEFESLVREAVG